MTSDTTMIERNQHNGQFKVGHTGIGGRPRGARSKLGEAFVEDLRDVWETHGKQALIECATTEPAQFVRVLASLMPKDINLSGNLDPAAFAITFERALAMLGNEPPVKPRRPLRVINHAR